MLESGVAITSVLSTATIKHRASLSFSQIILAPASILNL
jgi:hypothetical protein